MSFVLSSICSPQRVAPPLYPYPAFPYTKNTMASAIYGETRMRYHITRPKIAYISAVLPPEPYPAKSSSLAGGQAVLRAPFATEGYSNNSSNSGHPAWSEVRNGLKDAVGGGMLAQLVQELLLCCQQGGVPSAAATTAAATGTGQRSLASGGGDATPNTAGAGRGGRARMWGGAEEARVAAGCLDALCSFAPGTTVWRRLLPGTFSGLFRAIRGIEVGSGLAGGSGDEAGGIGSALALGGSHGGSGSRPSGDGRRGGGGSKSALAEACLGVLGKVLLMCAGAGGAEAASGAAASGQFFDMDGGSGRGGVGVGGMAETSNSNDTDNPLLALQRLAVSSNASSRTAGVAQDHTTAVAATASTASPAVRGQSGTTLPKTAPSASAAAAAAAAAAVIAVEDPEWDARTSDRLRLLLPPLLAFCCLHPGWRVRRATANLAADLLEAGGGGGDDGGSGRGEGGPMAQSKSGGQSGLLKPLTALLVEALVGLLLDDMPQVGVEGGRGPLLRGVDEALA